MPEIESSVSSIIKLRPCRFVKETLDRFGKIEDPSPEFCDTALGTLRVAVECLASAGGQEAAAAANRIADAEVC